MKLSPRSALAALAVASASCSDAPSVAERAPLAEGAWTIDPGDDLNAFFDCLAKDGATLVSAHRGGPRAGLPENAIETMRATMETAPAILEVDVAASADGVLYLMHDDTLERTTTGEGAADGLPFAQIEKLALEDPQGVRTPFHPARLDAALAFARERTILQIDFKPSARFEDVVAAIRAAGAQNRVILIAYTLGAARKLRRLAPDMTISLTVEKPEDLAAATAARLDGGSLVAFTGVRAPDAALYKTLAAAGVEIIFGTLGRDGIDRMIEETGDDSQYAELSRVGVDILATDRPAEAEAALEKAGRAAKAGRCGVSRGALSAPR